MIRLQTLGQLDLRTADGHELTAILAQPKRLALLIYIASLPEPRFCRRDTLIGLFWPELDAARARAALRKALHFLRQQIGDDVFARRGADEIGLKEGALASDVADLERANREQQFERVLELYRGEFLKGFFVEGAPELEQWIESERQRVRNLAVSAAWTVAEARQSVRDYEGSRRWAEWALQSAPPSEAALRRLLGLLDRAGDRAAAIAAYHNFAERLADEYGIAPSEETRALLDTLRTRVGEMQPRRAASDMPPPPLRIPPIRRRWPIAASAAVALLVVAVASWALLVRRNAPLDVTTRIAVLPFDVRASSELQYLDDGLVVLLSTRLDGAGALRTINSRTVLNAVERRGRANPGPVAENVGAQLYVTGSVAQAGSQLVVEAALYRRGSERVVVRAHASGKESELLSLVDDLARQLLAGYVQRSGSNVAESAVLTSSSLPALKAFLRGEDLLRSARYEDARAVFLQATAIDTAFALAYYRQSVASAWTGRMIEAIASATEAARFSHRLNERTRQLVEALLEARAGSLAEAEHLYRLYVERYPDDIEAWFELAEAVFHSRPARGGSVSDARQAFMQVLAHEPDNQPALVHLARIAATERKVAELDSITTRVLLVAPKGDHATEMRMLRAAMLRDRAAEEALIGNVVAEGGSRLLDAAWRASAYVPELTDLRRIVSRLEPELSGEWHAGGLLLQAHLSAAVRDWPGTFAALDRLQLEAPVAALATRALFASDPRSPFAHNELNGLRARLTRVDARARSGPASIYVGHSARDTLDPSVRDYYVAAISLRLNDDATALTRLEAIEGRTNSPYAPAAGHHLAALIALRQGRTDAALELLHEVAQALGSRTITATPFLPRAMIRHTIVNTLITTGQRADAERWQRSLPEDLAFGVYFAH